MAAVQWSIMGSKKSSKQNGPHQASKPKRRKRHLILTIFACAAIGGAGGWLYYNSSGMRADPKRKASSAQTFSVDNFQKLVGRWLRPDGGYVLEIRNIDHKGLLEVAYFNPRPIHVSQARLASVNAKPQVFVELRDAGYPGATYTLVYFPNQDVLAGQYYQPTAGQSFDVIFVRQNP